MAKITRFLLIPLVSIFFIALAVYFISEEAESDSKGPVQPILFSHKIHAKDNKIPCEFCHSYVDVSPNAGIPSVQKCMGCHEHIQGRDVEYDINGTTINIREEIGKVKEYWARGEAIPWVKVTGMPDHVHFNHKRHIKSGIECQTCHGPVEEMDVVYQAEKLNMGFCISCHQEKADDEQHAKELNDCLTCHY